MVKDVGLGLANSPLQNPTRGRSYPLSVLSVGDDYSEERKSGKRVRLMTGTLTSWSENGPDNVLGGQNNWIKG